MPMTAPQLVRDKILSRGLVLASAQGLHALSVGDLARELDLSRSGIFQHFSTPESLQLGILDRAAELFISEVVEPGQQAPAGEARIRALFTLWLKWSRAPRLSGGCPFVHASSASDSLPDAVRAKLAEVLDGWSSVLTTAIEDGKAASLVSSDIDAPQLVFELYGLYLSHHFWHWSMHDSQAMTRTMRAYERLARSMAA
jgi:AcrR family transcriptional regulator